jgi:Asp-tRNA(Asn)/Glu-tRNA(Gln) amidotransferase B subunit
MNIYKLAFWTSLSLIALILLGITTAYSAANNVPLSYKLDQTYPVLVSQLLPRECKAAGLEGVITSVVILGAGQTPQGNTPELILGTPGNKDIALEYEAVIGLETHIQLNTTDQNFLRLQSRFLVRPAQHQHLPGLHRYARRFAGPERAVVEKGVLLAAAMHADTASPSRILTAKTISTPTCPKATRFRSTIVHWPKAATWMFPCPRGDSGLCRVTIWKLHLEEDAGKTKNESGRRRLIDFNRCGVPLVEMVTEPDLRSADEAAQYLIRLRQLLRWIGVSEADMEKAHLRCDANVSIRPVKGADYLNTKTEIKNVNSIEAVREAIEKEVERQIHANTRLAKN